MCLLYVINSNTFFILLSFTLYPNFIKNLDFQFSFEFAHRWRCGFPTLICYEIAKTKKTNFKFVFSRCYPVKGEEKQADYKTVVWGRKFDENISPTNTQNVFNLSLAIYLLAHIWFKLSPKSQFAAHKRENNAASTRKIIANRYTVITNINRRNSNFHCRDFHINPMKRSRKTC